jgi:predicted neuraminidase
LHFDKTYRYFGPLIRPFLACHGRFIKVLKTIVLLHRLAWPIEKVYKHLYTQTPESIMNSVRWNIAVSPDTDQSVRMFIAAQGGGRKGDLSRFIEEAVRAYLLERAVEQAKTATGNMSEAELTDLVDEAVQWAREH